MVLKPRHQAAAEHRSIRESLSTIKIKSENDKLSCFIHTVVGTAPSPRNSSRLRMSLQPAFFQRRSRRRPGLAPIIEYPVPCFGPRSPTHSQSLGSEHLDPIALTVAAATMMHSDVLGGRFSPTTAHAFRSGRRPSHGHRLRILSKFTMYIDNEIEISDMQK